MYSITLGDGGGVSIIDRDGTMWLLKATLRSLHVVLAAVVLQVYYETLSPSIAGGDSGEIVAEGCILGTAHPPGYPLLTMLIYGIKHLDQFLPWATSVAYRVNAFSAVCTVLAGVFIALIVKNLSATVIRGAKLSTHEYAGGGHLISAGLFAFSPLIWQYAVTAEVFPLNTLFSALILYLVTAFAARRQVWVAVVGAFVCGLALCNQHTIVLFEVRCELRAAFMRRAHAH